jgi:hypothetical protein
MCVGGVRVWEGVMVSEGENEMRVVVWVLRGSQGGREGKCPAAM